MTTIDKVGRKTMFNSFCLDNIETTYLFLLCTTHLILPKLIERSVVNRLISCSKLFAKAGGRWWQPPTRSHQRAAFKTVDKCSSSETIFVTKKTQPIVSTLDIWTLKPLVICSFCLRIIISSCRHAITTENWCVRNEAQWKLAQNLPLPEVEVFGREYFYHKWHAE